VSFSLISKSGVASSITPLHISMDFCRGYPLCMPVDRPHQISSDLGSSGVLCIACKYEPFSNPHAKLSPLSSQSQQHEERPDSTMVRFHHGQISPWSASIYAPQAKHRQAGKAAEHSDPTHWRARLHSPGMCIEDAALVSEGVGYFSLNGNQLGCTRNGSHQPSLGFRV